MRADDQRHRLLRIVGSRDANAKLTPVHRFDFRLVDREARRRCNHLVGCQARIRKGIGRQAARYDEKSNQADEKPDHVLLFLVGLLVVYWSEQPVHRDERGLHVELGNREKIGLGWVRLGLDKREATFLLLSSP